MWDSNPRAGYYPATEFSARRNQPLSLPITLICTGCRLRSDDCSFGDYHVTDYTKPVFIVATASNDLASIRLQRSPNPSQGKLPIAQVERFELPAALANYRVGTDRSHLWVPVFCGDERIRTDVHGFSDHCYLLSQPTQLHHLVWV